MAHKRKRKPKLSYDEKYRQIKQSKFSVDIKRPTTTSTKAMVTKYHRILFGGRKSTGEYNRGLARQFTPTTSAHSDSIKAIWGIKGASRITSAYFPKQLGSVSNVTRNFLTVRHGFKVFNINPTELMQMSYDERLMALQPLKNYRTQIIVGGHIQDISFPDLQSLLEALDVVYKLYTKKDPNKSEEQLAREIPVTIMATTKKKK